MRFAMRSARCQAPETDGFAADTDGFAPDTDGRAPETDGLGPAAGSWPAAPQQLSGHRRIPVHRLDRHVALAHYFEP
ncbi:hypothetical protein GCM10009839_70570 [Catenulispora yoronensis]|uniref:Uncharacterized protein n=1 Tax=Catenulispora yoronensis TaxID=450799 RepID=A0ABN2V6E0_9ACTN